jgi:hypothetical protein
MGGVGRKQHEAPEHGKPVGLKRGTGVGGRSALAQTNLECVLEQITSGMVVGEELRGTPVVVAWQGVDAVERVGAFQARLGRWQCRLAAVVASPARWTQVEEGRFCSLLLAHLRARLGALEALLELDRRVRKGRRAVAVSAELGEGAEREVRAVAVQLALDVGLGLVLAWAWGRKGQGTWTGLRRAAEAMVGGARLLLGTDALRERMRLLSLQPGGFKLNVPLTTRLASMADMALDLPLPWPRPLAMPSLLASLGATGAICGVLDVLRVCGLQLWALQAVLGRLYHLEVSLLGSMWRLFRGKKRNVLRGRIDSCEYSTQQLLLGTVLFTVLACLLPTLAAFHLLFTGTLALLTAAQAAALFLLLLLRDLPFWPLAVALTNPASLPGGVRCECISPAASEAQAGAQGASYLRLRSCRVPLSTLFQVSDGEEEGACSASHRTRRANGLALLTVPPWTSRRTASP